MCVRCREGWERTLCQVSRCFMFGAALVRCCAGSRRGQSKAWSGTALAAGSWRDPDLAVCCGFVHGAALCELRLCVFFGGEGEGKWWCRCGGGQEAAIGEERGEAHDRCTEGGGVCVGGGGGVWGGAGGGGRGRRARV